MLLDLGGIGLWVERNTCGGPGEIRRTEILLKPKVVFEKDAVGDGK